MTGHGTKLGRKAVFVWEHLRCRDSISQIRAHHNGGMLCPCGYSYSVNKAVGCKKQSSYQLSHHTCALWFGSRLGHRPSIHEIHHSILHLRGRVPTIISSQRCLPERHAAVPVLLSVQGSCSASRRCGAQTTDAAVRRATSAARERVASAPAFARANASGGTGADGSAT